MLYLHTHRRGSACLLVQWLRIVLYVHVLHLGRRDAISQRARRCSHEILLYRTPTQVPKRPLARDAVVPLSAVLLFLRARKGHHQREVHLYPT